MKIIETHFKDHSGDGDDRLRVTIETTEDKGEVEFGSGEPEDMYLHRNLSDAWKIKKMLKMAYNAGKDNEPLEIIEIQKAYGDDD